MASCLPSWPPHGLPSRSTGLISTCESVLALKTCEIRHLESSAGLVSPSPLVKKCPPARRRFTAFAEMCRGVAPRRGFDDLLGSYDAQRAAQLEKAGWAQSPAPCPSTGMEQLPPAAYAGVSFCSLARAPAAATAHQRSAPVTVYTLTLPPSNLHISPFASEQAAWEPAPPPAAQPTVRRAASDAVASWLAGWAALAAEQGCSSSDDDYDCLPRLAATVPRQASSSPRAPHHAAAMHCSSGGSGCGSGRAAPSNSPACFSIADSGFPTTHQLLPNLPSLDTRASGTRRPAAPQPQQPCQWREAAPAAAAAAPSAASTRHKRRRQEAAARPAKRQQTRPRRAARQAAPTPQPRPQQAAAQPCATTVLAGPRLEHLTACPADSCGSGSASPSLLDLPDMDALWASDDCWDEEVLPLDLLADDVGLIMAGDALAMRDVLARSLDLSEFLEL
ncbi:hypothetical protein CHLNCDRAFT_56787 [Chlorella variabilis]|uniref:Uncharacterized protein n=1 Tax=Chlorella variabilis TaxID=554065 RepID=E1Z5C5_CHLVA|nr:hypothetical protein CHLNCDRAFT_56787 [Chlorella variabilis]EFN59503.1 hypothetical protein CHLNCDRAFT_56787 [Chlorella variabilis]|eukprot:XP_005851605.1 hypothetical protein CHLNCDRAFT_56787 [Chlorella variabilis]